MQSELKPCPLCGADFKMGQEPQDNHPVAGQFYLYHNYGPLGSVARLCPLSINRHFYTEVEAIAAWNDRASDAEITRLTEALRAAEEEKKALREALEEISDLPGEINPCNYDHDDACELNRQFCYGLLIARQALAGAKP